MESTQVISKNQIKLIKSLALKKYRVKHNLFVVEGRKLIEELLASELTIETLFTTSPDFTPQGVKVQHIDDKSLAQVSLLSQPHFGLALVKIPTPKARQESGSIHLVLDGISDPGNLGTIIRVADWYGLSQITCINNCVDPFNPKVVQASMGSLFRMHLLHQNIGEEKFHSPVYGAFLNANDLGTLPLTLGGTLVIGNESEGISEEMEALCDHKISIPRYGKAESLNAAMATGIILDRFSQIKE